MICVAAALAGYHVTAVQTGGGAGFSGGVGSQDFPFSLANILAKTFSEHTHAAIFRNPFA